MNNKDYLKKFVPDDELAHSGAKGMKWYRRRYQNYDGTLTPAGRKRYGVGPAREASIGVSDEDIKRRASEKAEREANSKGTFNIPLSKKMLDKKKEATLTEKARMTSDNESKPLNEKIFGDKKKEESESKQETKKDSPEVKKVSDQDTNKTTKVEAPKEVKENNSSLKPSEIANKQSSIYSNASTAATKAGDLVSKAGAPKNKKFDVSNMSDQELRDVVNRMSMENSYNRLMSDRTYQKNGADYCADLLKTTGEVLAIASSAMLVAKGIRELREARNGK